jgi:hypothetical protein
MAVIDRQVHGYRQGHQLLASSLPLSREDQSTIDRLSDVAGPLRPREQFEPYLTGYPLPSGSFYVLARTWQDLTVPRAGCVRTLSLVIPASTWGSLESLLPLLDMLDLGRLPEDEDAKRMALASVPDNVLPTAANFNGGELLEAIFLEDYRPVVVFDAASPELVTIRLLTALWPSMRLQFSVSTFALSPRKISGRDFNLVFAPKDARPKFSDWNGRRIDGRSPQDLRHRWTGTIMGRVFEAPYPRLLSSGDEDIVAGVGNDGDNAAALRIALLWDELMAKLDSTPTAALGLLDIANSGKVRRSVALQTLESSLTDAVKRAPSVLPQDEAWNFLGALTRKMHGRSIPGGIDAVGSALADLSQRSPEGAISLLSQPDELGAIRELVPVIAGGMSDGFSHRVEHSLLSAPPEVLGNLIAGSTKLAKKVSSEVHLIDRIGEILPQLDASLASMVSHELLPHLVMDWQLPAAQPLLTMLDAEQLAEEVRHVGLVNDFAATNMARACLTRAREIGAKGRILSVLSDLPDTERRNKLLAEALDPSVEDATWLIQCSKLSRGVSVEMLVDLMRQADDQQLERILEDRSIRGDVIRIAEEVAPDLVHRMIFAETVPIDVFVRLVRGVIETSSADNKVKIANHALSRCLIQHFGEGELEFLAQMFDFVGKHLDGAWVVRLGMADRISASVVNRNMVAFCKAAKPARFRIMSSIVDIALLLRDRRIFDLDGKAADACADLLFEAEKAVPRFAITAAGHLLPMLMRQLNRPVSLMIAATFPIIYRELAKKDEVPDLLKFIPFFDWDRCKAARQELVSAFMASSWAPGHLALTACRCSDVTQILRRVAKIYGGDAYLQRIASELGCLPSECRRTVEKVIASVRSE